MIERLRLTDYRGFEALDITFEPDVTLLVGVNGAGKSSVLLALTTLLGGPPGTDWVRAGSERALLSLEGEHGFSSSLEATSDHPPKPIGLQDPLAVPRALTFWSDRSGAAHQDVALANLGARHHWWNVAGSTASFFQWLHQREDIENEAIRFDAAKVDPQLDRVRCAVFACFPGFDRIRFKRAIEGGQTRTSLWVRKDGVELPFEALSDGERAVFVMVGDIARRNAMISPSDDTPFVLMIDEVEAHLHPQWQHRVLSDLRRVFPAAQIIATTHSPIVASSVPTRSLRLLRDFSLVPVDHTGGRDANDLLEEVFGVPPRPQEVKRRLDALGDLIDDSDYPAAERELAALTDLLGPNDSELAYYRGMLHGRRASA